MITVADSAVALDAFAARSKRFETVCVVLKFGAIFSITLLKQRIQLSVLSPCRVASAIEDVSVRRIQFSSIKVFHDGGGS
jgi:hypothetical protein